MNGISWFAWYPNDHLPTSLRLSLAEEGALHRLFDQLFFYGGKLPDDDNLLARLIRIECSEWFAMRENISQFFKISGGFWTHPRLCFEMKKAQKLHISRQSGGHNRWKNKRKLDNSSAISSATSPAISSADSSPPSSAHRQQGERQSQSNNKKDFYPLSSSETQTPRARARGQRHIPNKINGLGVTHGRSAPLARPEASPKTNGIALKSHRKELLRQKLYRFSDATKTGEERHKAFAGLTGADPEHSEQHWFDKLDIEMRAAKWDDVPK